MLKVRSRAGCLTVRGQSPHAENEALLNAAD
jgi:hypothetical protein